MNRVTLELVLLTLGALVFFILSAIWLRSTIRQEKRIRQQIERDPTLLSDAHIDARRRELARLNRPAAEGFRAHPSDGPRWRFDDPPATKKGRPQ